MKTTAVYLEVSSKRPDALKLIGGLRATRIDCVERESFLGQQYACRVVLADHRPPRPGLFADAGCQCVRKLQPRGSAGSPSLSLRRLQSDFSLQKGAQTEIGPRGRALWNNRGDLTVALFDIEKKDLLTSTIFDNVRVNSHRSVRRARKPRTRVRIAPAAGLASGRQPRLHVEGRVRGLQREPWHRGIHLAARAKPLPACPGCRRRAPRRSSTGATGPINGGRATSAPAERQHENSIRAWRAGTTLDAAVTIGGDQAARNAAQVAISPMSSMPRTSGSALTPRLAEPSSTGGTHPEAH